MAKRTPIISPPPIGITPIDVHGIVPRTTSRIISDEGLVLHIEDQVARDEHGKDCCCGDCGGGCRHCHNVHDRPDSNTRCCLASTTDCPDVVLRDLSYYLKIEQSFTGQNEYHTCAEGRITQTAPANVQMAVTVPKANVSVLIENIMYEDCFGYVIEEPCTKSGSVEISIDDLYAACRDNSGKNHYVAHIPVSHISIDGCEVADWGAGHFCLYHRNVDDMPCFDMATNASVVIPWGAFDYRYTYSASFNITGHSDGKGCNRQCSGCE